MTCKSTTHHTGCPCHEARRDAEIERLRRKIGEWASRIEQDCADNLTVRREMEKEAGK